MQRQIHSHAIEPFNTKLFDDETWTHFLDIATQDLFNKIYYGAKNEDAILLEQIKKSYLGDPCHSLTVYWNGETPMSLLAKEGDEKSVKFLLDLIQPSSPHILNCEKKFSEENVGDNKSALYASASSTMVSINYPNFYLAIERFSKSNDKTNFFDHGDFFATEILPRRLSILSEARLGNAKKVVELRNVPNADILYDNYNAAIYLYALYGHYEIADIFSSVGFKTSVAMGYLKGGHINHYINTINSSYLTNLLSSVIEDARYNYNYGNFNHPSILFPILVGLSSSAKLRNELLDSICEKNHFYKYWHGNDQLQFENNLKSLKNETSSQAALTYHWMTNYQLHLNQASSCLKVEVLTWLLLGRRINEAHNLDIFLKILSYIIEPPLNYSELLSIYNNVNFVFAKNFLVNDIDNYLSGFYNSQRYHYSRAKSFKTACHEVSKPINLSKLISEQLGLFSKTVIGNPKSQYKHEQSLSNQTEDKFVEILKKHNCRY